MTSMIAAESSTRTRNLPPVECTTWCKDGGGHTEGVRHPADQYCSSEAETVPMTRERLIEGYEPGSRMLDYLQVNLIRERFEAEGHIELGRNDLAGIELTVDEALELARVLTLLARAARTT